jgi:transcriptional regulator with XRE-family HTH domain
MADDLWEMSPAVTSGPMPESTRARRTRRHRFPYLSKLENGRMDPPSAETIVKLARALGAHPDGLLLLAGKMPEEIAVIVT